MRVLLMVCGSVAAKLTPKMVKVLETAGHEVKIVASSRAIFFFDQVNLQVFTDADEWQGNIYQKDMEVLHISLAEWADVILIAPITGNTLAKMALGLCDNLPMSIIRAWPRHKRIIIAPAMNTRMWYHPASVVHLVLVKLMYRVKVVWPVKKLLACGLDGVGAMADITDIVAKLR